MTFGAETSRDRTAVSPAASPIRVLVVDDDPFFVLAATALLEAEGMHVVGSAPNGAQAIVAAAALRPDVVTLDIDMPVMDGIATTQRLHEENENVPIVLVSGSESDARVAAARASGAAAHVDKLRVATELADVVRAISASTRAAAAEQQFRLTLFE
jgi:CheY-like chemotaxis protein